MNTTNHLTTLDNLDRLTPKQQEYVRLRVAQTPVKNIEAYVVKIALAEILVKAAFDLGSPMADDAIVLKFQTEGFFKELKGRFANLTIFELKEAFNRGIRGEFGQFFGLCPRTYHQFIKHFYELPERQKAWLEYMAGQEELKKSPKPVFFTTDQLKQFAINDFETYRQSGKLPFYPHATYNIICEAIGTGISIDGKMVKTLITDRALAKELFLQAKKEYLAKLESGFKRGRISADEKAQLSDLKQIRSFEFLLKKYYLITFFKQLIADNRKLVL